MLISAAELDSLTMCFIAIDWLLELHFMVLPGC